MEDLKRYDKFWDISARDLIIDDIDEAICAVDKDGIVTVWNKKSELIYDIEKSEILGKKMDDCLPDTVIMEVLKTGKEQQDIYKSTRTGCSILVRAKMLYSNGEMVGVMCVDKDLSELDELQSQVDKLKERISFLENRSISDNMSAVVGNSPQMEELMYKASKVAKSDANILITGESGVGKKALSKEIHKLSEKKGVFLTVNCGAVPMDLFEEEFFGISTKDEEKAGLFELSEGGTLYLGEIADMPIKMQSKLLNVLQNGMISRVGSKKRIPVNSRIISSTSRDIKELVYKGEFLEDLYYRLNVIEIDIPPLRNRGSDIIALTEHFLDILSRKYQIEKPVVTSKVTNILLSYDWKGNLRELQNILEHMVVMSNGKEITVDMVPYALRERASRHAYGEINDLAKTVGEFEKSILEEILENNDWNKSKAARMLNIPRTTLMYKIEQYSLSPKKKRKK